MLSSTGPPGYLVNGGRCSKRGWRTRCPMPESTSRLPHAAAARAAGHGRSPGDPADPQTRRVFGVRLWLALMFAAIGILTGTTVYLVVSGSSENAAENRAADLAAGRTGRLADAGRGRSSRPGG